MAKQGLLVKQSGLVLTVESRGTRARHGGHIALNGRFIGVRQQFPGGVNLETGTVLRALPPGCSPSIYRRGSDLSVLLGGDVLVFGDDAFDRLGVLMPEQEICSQLEILCCVEGDKMDVI